jgi:chromosomal replication initiation ATPase DnaA
VRSAFDGDTGQFLRLVADVTGVSVSQMQSRCRDRDIVSARRTAVLAWRKLNRQTSEIAASLSIGVAAATHLVRRNADHDLQAERNADKLISLCNSEVKNST